MNCREKYKDLLCDVPSIWREPLIEILCGLPEGASALFCEQVKQCETITQLSPFIIRGSLVCFTYTDERGNENERCFDINRVLDKIDPKCIATKQEWAGWSLDERITAVLNNDKVYCCTTTSSTTSTSTSSTTTIKPPVCVGVTGIIWNLVEQTTTTSTTTINVVPTTTSTSTTTHAPVTSTTSSTTARPTTTSTTTTTTVAPISTVVSMYSYGGDGSNQCSAQGVTQLRFRFATPLIQDLKLDIAMMYYPDNGANVYQCFGNEIVPVNHPDKALFATYNRGVAFNLVISEGSSEYLSNFLMYPDPNFNVNNGIISYPVCNPVWGANARHEILIHVESGNLLTLSTAYDTPSPYNTVANGIIKLEQI